MNHRDKLLVLDLKRTCITTVIRANYDDTIKYNANNAVIKYTAKVRLLYEIPL